MWHWHHGWECLSDSTATEVFLYNPLAGRATWRYLFNCLSPPRACKLQDGKCLIHFSPFSAQPISWKSANVNNSVINEYSDKANIKQDKDVLISFSGIVLPATNLWRPSDRLWSTLEWGPDAPSGLGNSFSQLLGMLPAEAHSSVPPLELPLTKGAVLPKLYHQREPHTCNQGSNSCMGTKAWSLCLSWDNSKELSQVQNSTELSLAATASRPLFLSPACFPFSPGSLLHTDVHLPICFLGNEPDLWQLVLGLRLWSGSRLALPGSFLSPIWTTHPLTLFTAHLKCTISEEVSLIVPSNTSLAKSIASISSHVFSFYAVINSWNCLGLCFLICLQSCPLLLHQDVSSRM